LLAKRQISLQGKYKLLKGELKASWQAFGESVVTNRYALRMPEAIDRCPLEVKLS
jgi:hypothetical protein